MRHLAILGLALVGCGGSPTLPQVAPSAPSENDAARALLDAAHAKWDAAQGLADVEPALRAYEAALAKAPDDRLALERAAALYDRYGMFLLPEDDREAQMQAFLKGRDAALRAMAQNPQFRTAYEQDQDMVKAVGALTIEDVGATYWAAVNWAHWGERHGIVRAALDIPKVKAMVDRVNELDPKYLAHAADRFLIGYWVAIPGFAGKDPEKSRAAYERAIADAPDYLDNHVIYAQYYCKDVEDKNCFVTSLERVLNAPLDADDSPYRLDNAIARSQAKVWLDKTTDIFE